VFQCLVQKDTEQFILRDDWNKVLDNGRPFSDFCPDWRDAMV
jgi:hypothetical protein